MQSAIPPNEYSKKVVKQQRRTVATTETPIVVPIFPVVALVFPSRHLSTAAPPGQQKPFRRGGTVSAVREGRLSAHFRNFADVILTQRKGTCF